MKLMMTFFLVCIVIGLYAPRLAARSQWLIFAASVVSAALGLVVLAWAARERGSPRT